MSFDRIPDVTADTSLAALAAADPASLDRLARVHPAFGPGVGVPGSARLGDMAKATGIPLAVILATAQGAIHVTAPAGGCGCSCGGGGH